MQDYFLCVKTGNASSLEWLPSAISFENHIQDTRRSPEPSHRAAPRMSRRSGAADGSKGTRLAKPVNPYD